MKPRARDVQFLPLPIAAVVELTARYARRTRRKNQPSKCRKEDVWDFRMCVTLGHIGHYEPFPFFV